MERQWLLSAAENDDHALARSSRADFSSFMQDSLVRPVAIPSMPAARQLGSTLRGGTASAATAMRLDPTRSGVRGIIWTPFAGGPCRKRNPESAGGVGFKEAGGCG